MIKRRLRRPIAIYGDSAAKPDVEVVIGEWGAYNNAGKNALGSKWLNLAQYPSYDAIAAELKREGFDVDDGEFFIQDIEGKWPNDIGFDGMNPKEFYDVLKDAGCLDDIDKFNMMKEYLSARNWSDFVELVQENGRNWGSTFYYIKADGPEELAENYIDELGGLSVLGNDEIEHYFDYKSYGKDLELDAIPTDHGYIFDK